MYIAIQKGKRNQKEKTTTTTTHTNGDKSTIMDFISDPTPVSMVSMLIREKV